MGGPVGGAALNIASGLRERALSDPTALAVVDGDRRFTAGVVDERANRVAQALLGSGLRPGDTVAVLLGNRAEYVEVAAGLAKSGLVMVPLNPRSVAAEHEYVADHADVRALVVDHAFVAVASGVAERAAVVLEIDGDDLGPAYESALASAATRDPLVRVDERDPFCIAYTSGTTGAPKGVAISHRSRALTFFCSALEWGLGPSRHSIAVAPLYHGAGFAFGYTPVHCGGSVSMLRAWDPERLLAMIESDRAQSVFLVPAHAQMLRALGDDALDRYDLSSLDTLYFNAAALPVLLKEWVLDAFPGVGVHELYGSTEAGIVSNLRPPDARARAGSVGRPWYMTETRVVDDEGRPVGPGEPGELFSRSPFLMNGYHDNPEATASCTTEDGFLSSGDVVVADEQGYLTIVDRKKDMIVSGGENVFPRDIENVLASHPTVAEAAVVGLPSETWGEQVTAYVVLRDGAALDRAALEQHARTHLAGYKVPREWRTVEALPRNASGKILKRVLRDVSTDVRA